jgi:hypothetical protein
LIESPSGTAAPVEPALSAVLGATQPRVGYRELAVGVGTHLSRGIRTVGGIFVGGH